MEKERGGAKWRFGPNETVIGAGDLTVRAVLNKVIDNVDENGGKPVVPLGHGDPSSFSCFRTTGIAEDAIVSAVQSARFNCYAFNAGMPSTRR